MKRFIPLLLCLAPTLSTAHVFAYHEGSNAAVGLSDQAIGVCADRPGGWKSAFISIYVLPKAHIQGCWQLVSPTDAARRHLRPGAVQICPLPNAYVPTTCMYTLKDEFVDPDTLPKQAEFK